MNIYALEILMLQCKNEIEKEARDGWKWKTEKYVQIIKFACLSSTKRTAGKVNS